MELVRRDLMRNCMGLPPAADDDRHGENHKIKTNDDQSAPCDAAANMVAASDALDERERRPKWQQHEVGAGRTPVGIYAQKDLGRVVNEEWKEVRRDRREAERERGSERRQAALQICFRNQGQEEQRLLTAWRNESQGWHRMASD